MVLPIVFSLLSWWLAFASATIIENGRAREVVFEKTSIVSIREGGNEWKSYANNATEISYKGRWDGNHISWWSAPGLKLGFTGGKIAVSFGAQTSPGVLVAYRFDTLDWQFTNVTASGTHQFTSPPVQQQGTETFKLNTGITTARTFELRVTNWAYGVQIQSIHLSPNGTLFKPPSFSRNIEFIGDSLTAGEYATYESVSSWSWSLCKSLGTECTISAFPGNCLVDTECWGNPRGQSHQWFQTRDTSYRATQMKTADEKWDFKAHQAADLVFIHLGTNDYSPHNNVSAARFQESYIEFVKKIHGVWPSSQVVLVSLANGFWLDAGTGRWHQAGALVDEIRAVYKTFEKEGWIHYFNSSGVLAHNDIGPQWHYTDVGHIKLASALLQFVRMKFGWEIEDVAAGPEVMSGTTYWNDQAGY
ncbi:hypothetical protein BLS_000781 [Venturia inaequalis]|uniref:SGNH hydrolase-type esterase domain-containing protein n=1 Tax=Venturia inaequalis TaxID=5025 RepID=A0A8H3U2E1_VENIN|nr:hypothetical protein BLS_000781 [Venturia inaequalis]RDI82664.1 hypothetical protein Vi05172_g7427 [Venturia inaequalis]